MAQPFYSVTCSLNEHLHYETVRIQIAFHPQEERFEVANPAIRKDVAWIEDVAEVFAPETSVFHLVGNYCAKNSDVSQDAVFASIEKLRKGSASDVDIEPIKA